MTNRVFLLGAGFSKSAGFPLAKELVCFIRNLLNASRNSKDIDFKTELSDFFIGINPSLLLNIELLLTYIDLALIDDSVGMFTRFAPPRDLRLFRMRLSGALVRAFDNVHLDWREERKKKEIYRKFCEKLKKGDTVITFNYDLIVEQELWFQRKWTFLDGYGLKKDVNDFQAPFGGTYPSDLPTESLIKVYKLHGSLGWIYDDGLPGQIIFQGMPNYFDGRLLFCEKNLIAASARWDEGTTFIEPTYIKRFNCTPILDIWKQAFQALQQSNELITIGYSLPQADAAAQAFLASGIHTSRITSITVVNPDNSVYDKFEMVFGRKVIKRRETFEEWIALPPK